MRILEDSKIIFHVWDIGREIQAVDFPRKTQNLGIPLTFCSSVTCVTSSASGWSTGRSGHSGGSSTHILLSGNPSNSNRAAEMFGEFSWLCRRKFNALHDLLISFQHFKATQSLEGFHMEKKYDDFSQKDGACFGPVHALKIPMDFHQPDPPIHGLWVLHASLVEWEPVVKFIQLGGNSRGPMRNFRLRSLRDLKGHMRKIRSSTHSGHIQIPNFPGNADRWLCNEGRSVRDTLRLNKQILVDCERTRSLLFSLNVTIDYSSKIRRWGGKRCGAILLECHSCHLKNARAESDLFVLRGEWKYVAFYASESTREMSGKGNPLISLSAPFHHLTWFCLCILMCISISLHFLRLRENFLPALFFVITSFLFQGDPPGASFPRGGSQNAGSNAPLRARWWFSVFWILGAFLTAQFFLAELTSNQVAPQTEEIDVQIEELISKGYKFEPLVSNKEDVKAKLESVHTAAGNAEPNSDLLFKISQNWFGNDTAVDKRLFLVQAEHRNAYRLLLPYMENRSFHSIQREISVSPLWVSLSSPNADLILSSLLTSFASGVFHYWEKWNKLIRWRDLINQYDLPWDEDLWASVYAEKRDGEEQGNLPSIQNSLHKSALFLFVCGLVSAFLVFGIESFRVFLNCVGSKL
jgi:hypothetical protein